MERPEVLYVDDDTTNVFLFTSLFDSSYSLCTAQSGYEGLDMLATYNSIKVVISDMKMPGLNGVEFVTKAKKIYPDKVYYILTGFDIIDEIQLAISNGIIKKYMQKPFQIDEIEEAINSFL